MFFHVFIATLEYLLKENNTIFTNYPTKLSPETTVLNKAQQQLFAVSIGEGPPLNHVHPL